MDPVKRVKENIRDLIDADCAPLISQRYLSSSLCHECVIEKYSKLKEKTYYTMTHENEFPQRSLKLYKAKSSHSFQFHCELKNSDITKMPGCNLTSKMECCIAYDENEVINLNDLVETNYGFSIEVPIEIITDSKNKYLLESDKLIIQFRYRNYFCDKGIICHPGTTTKEEREKLSKDLLSLYESGVGSDFAIMDEDGKEHLVHKAICRSRSEYIRKIDEEQVVGVTIGGKSRHVDIVVRYMYSGILPELSLEDLLKVAEITERLEMHCLLVSVQTALLEKLNKNNAVQIRNACIKYDNLRKLAALAEDLLLPVKTERNKRGRKCSVQNFTRTI